jgi:hypothetical protein
MQNKPNFHKHQITPKPFYSKDIREFSALQTPQKQTQSNPIKPNFKANRTQSNPKQTQSNPISILPFCNPAHSDKANRNNYTSARDLCTMRIKEKSSEKEPAYGCKSCHCV